MRKSFPVEDLARDDRFVRVPMIERFNDPRTARVDDRLVQEARGPGRLTPDRPDAPDAARALMHGIFVGEIQALEGAGRTCWDFEVGTGNGEGIPEVPFELKLDMARQCWDEARHCEISIKLSELHGHRARRVLREHLPLRGGLQPRPRAAPHRRQPRPRGPRHRRVQHDARVRRHRRRPGARVLRGLDARRRGHPREDGLRLAAPPHRERQAERRERALEFQRVVDKLFSLGGFRGEEEDSPVRLARRFRELAGFEDDEMDTLAEIAKEARQEMEARIEANRAAVAR